MFATQKKPTLPAMVGALVLIATYSVAAGQSGRGEPAASAEARFRQLDSSGDGVLTLDEATVGTRSFMERLFKDAGKKPGDRLTHEEFLATYDRLRSKSTSGTTKTSPSAEPERSGSDAPPKGIGLIDANGDGMISRGEWSKFTQAFSRLDTDKDNSLSASELEATGGAAELLMKLADASGDEKITRVEWGKLIHSFARLDANKDNSLDVDEMEKVADANADAASGSASLSGKSAEKSGPTTWRGNIEGRGQIELVVDGKQIVGRELGGRGENLGAGTFTMTGDGKSGNMDAVYTDGNRSGDVCLGIYQMNGDTLLWCVNNRGGRPSSFQGGGGSWLLTLTRVSAGTSGTASSQ